MIEKIICAALVASMLLLCSAQAAGAQTAGGFGQQQAGFGQPQFQQPGMGQQQPQFGQQPGMGQQQPGMGQAPAGQPGQLNLPPAPQKPAPNMQYGNTKRAALIGEQFSQTSQGNANVYVNENGNNTVAVTVRLTKSADPYALAPTMANLTYMVDGIYELTDRAGNDILLTVLDPSGNVVTAAKFSDARNAFDYYNVPESARQTTQPAYGQQPQFGQQPGMGQQQPAMGQQPGFAGTGMQRPAAGMGQQQF